MRLIPIACLTLLLSVSSPCRVAGAGQKTMTLFLDAARIEVETGPGAGRGYLEHPLPEAMLPGSFRARPLGGTLLRVELIPAEQDQRRQRDIARLEERRAELQDRLQALSRREEIFAAALKSQSGKAPRKTKANPDPVASLQQGTEFALSQLEAVYRGKRKCQRALESVEQELASARKGVALARVWLSPGTRVRLSYLVGGVHWSPSYDLRCPGDAGAELLLHATLPPVEKGTRYLVSPGTLAQGLAAQAVRGDYPVLARHRLSLAVVPTGEATPATLAFSPVTATLPPGEASLYWRGEYLGSGRFTGTGAADFTLGK